MAGGGSRVQGRDECPPLRLIGTLGKHLLELVDHKQQPPGRRLSRRPAFRSAHRPWLCQGCLARDKGKPGRIGGQSLPHRGRVHSGQFRHVHGQFVQRRMSRGEHQARPGRGPGRGGQPCPPYPRQHPRLQQRGLARPRHPRHHQQTWPIYVSRHPLQHLRGGRLAAEEERRILLLERAQAPVGRINHPGDTHQRWRRDSIGPRPVTVAVDDLGVALADLHTHGPTGVNAVIADVTGLPQDQSRTRI